MAASASLKTEIVANSNYILGENLEEITIPIKYIGDVINANGYANKKHVKEIKLKLYINGRKVSSVSGSKTMNVGNEYMFKVNRDKFSPNITHSVNLKVEGYVHTEFNVDGLIQNEFSKEIKIKVEPKKVKPINSENVKILSKKSEKMVVSPLAQTINTKLENSVGFIEAGKYLAIKYNLNVSKDEMQEVKLYIDNVNIEKNNILDEFLKSNNKDKTYIVAIKIPLNTESSLYGINSLREKEGSYFYLQRINILDRKRLPHTLKMQFKYNGKTYVNEIKFDTFDNYLTNMNYTLEGGVINREEINKYEELQKWI